MHTLLSALFAAIFSFSHPAPAPPQPAPVEAYTQIAPEHIPSRHELRVSAVYAGSGCLSCRKTAVTYRMR